MDYFERFKLNIVICIFFLVITILIFLCIGKDAYPFIPILLIPIIIILKIYTNAKKLYPKIFDYEFYDIYSQLGFDCATETGYSLSFSEAKRLTFFYSPVLHIYKNSMIIRIGQRAMYIKDLSTVKLTKTAIEFNYNGTGYFVSFRYGIPKTVKDIIQKANITT